MSLYSFLSPHWSVVRLIAMSTTLAIKSFVLMVWFALAALCVMILFSSTAFAQAPIVDGPFSPYPPRFNPYLPNPVTGLPAASSSATSAGVNATASYRPTVIAPNGLRIPVPATATASVSKAAIAKGARVAVRALGPVGVGFLAYDIYKEIKDSGVTTCAPPDFFCKQNPGSDPAFAFMWEVYNPSTQSTLGVLKTSPEAACAQFNSSPGVPYGYTSTTATTGFCPNPTTGANSGRSVRRLSTCAPNYSPTGVCNYTGPALSPVPVTDAELEQTLQQKMDADYQLNQRLFDAMQKDLAERGLTDSANPISGLTPVSVDSPVVTTPPANTRTETTPLPDGSVDTKQTTESVKVTPTKSGSTVGDTTITYKTETTTNTTTTNNVTNNTTTSSTVTNSSPSAPSSTTAPVTEFPDDYNREVTQQKVLDELKGTGAPAAPPDQKVIVDAAKDEAKVAFDQLVTDAKTAQSTTDKSMWFSWVWTPPIGECVANSVTLTNGHAVSWDICPTVVNIRDVIGWLFALFGAYEIYLQLFRRG